MEKSKRFAAPEAAIRLWFWLFAAAALIAAGCFFGLRRMAAREFGGMSGDLAGYIITLSQLLMLLGYVFAERMAEVWF